jgi:hypothetical protein
MMVEPVVIAKAIDLVFDNQLVGKESTYPMPPI